MYGGRCVDSLCRDLQLGTSGRAESQELEDAPSARDSVRVPEPYRRAKAGSELCESQRDPRVEPENSHDQHSHAGTRPSLIARVLL